MSWTRGKFVDEIVPGLFALTIDTFRNRRATSMGDQIFSMKESSKAREQIAERSGLGFPTKKAEGAPIVYDTPISGSKQTWVHDVFALGVRITEEAIDDNLYELNNGKDKLGDIFFDLGEAMAENEETLAARFLVNGGATTYHETRAGNPLFYATHPRLDGSTFSNTTTTSADLTYTTFWTAVIAAENQYNHRQYRVKRKVKNLWIPPQLERNGLEILKSTDRPDTANRAVNAMKNSGRSIDLKIWQHLTDTDAWYLQLTGENIIKFNRRKTRFARERDFQTGDMMVKGDVRFSEEIDDEKGWYGVIPA